jgi:hypothetical protein
VIRRLHELVVGIVLGTVRYAVDSRSLRAGYLYLLDSIAAERVIRRAEREAELERRSRR